MTDSSIIPTTLPSGLTKSVMPCSTEIWCWDQRTSSREPILYSANFSTNINKLKRLLPLFLLFSGDFFRFELISDTQTDIKISFSQIQRVIEHRSSMAKLELSKLSNSSLGRFGATRRRQVLFNQVAIQLLAWRPLRPG